MSGGLNHLKSNRNLRLGLVKLLDRLIVALPLSEPREEPLDSLVAQGDLRMTEGIIKQAQL